MRRVGVIVVRANDWVTKHLFVVFGLPILAFFAWAIWQVVT